MRNNQQDANVNKNTEQIGAVTSNYVHLQTYDRTVENLRWQRSCDNGLELVNLTQDTTGTQLGHNWDTTGTK